MADRRDTLIARTLFSASMLFAISVPGSTAQEETAPLPPLEEQTISEDLRFTALKQVQDYMASTASLQAEFTQRAPSGSMSRGTLYLERPGKIRFDYSDDIPFLVVSDGEVLNFIDYEIGEVTRWPVKDTPLRALLGKTLDLTGLGASIDVMPAGMKDVISLSAVDDRHPDRGSITLYFKQNKNQPDIPLELISWTVTDAEGGLTYVDLDNSVRNPPLKPALWTFRDPRGATKRRRVR